MANKNRIRITYPSSEKIYIPGKIHKINVGMRKIKILDTVTRDENGELVHKKNNPVIVYDTSGPYSDPKIPVNTQNGIPRIRESWYAGRKDLIRLEELTSDYGRQRLADSSLDHIRFPKHHLPYRAKAGKNITQLYYAKRRIITPEMEYVAIRENQQIEIIYHSRICPQRNCRRACHHPSKHQPPRSRTDDYRPEILSEDQHQYRQLRPFVRYR